MMGSLPPEPKDSILRLVRILFDRTLNDSIEWASAGNDRFLHSTPRGATVIGSVDRDGEPPYDVVLFDEEGKSVASLQRGYDDPQDEFELLRDLYETARRHALNIDPFVDSLIAEIEGS